MADVPSEKLPKPDQKDAYYKKVVEVVEPLIVRDKKDKQDPDKIDNIANMEATRANLSNEADRLSKLIAEQSSSKSVTEECIKLLKDARELISKVNLDHEAVLMKMDEVKYRLIRAYESREEQSKSLLPLSLINFFWLAVIGFFIGWKMLIPGQDSLEQIGFVALACALWGGVGGVIDAFFALHTHFSNQDFDKRYRPWYIFHPLLGLALGAVIFLIIQAGLMAVTDTQLRETAQTTDEVTNEVMVNYEVANGDVVEVTNEETNNGGTTDKVTKEGTGEDNSGVPAGGTVLPIALAFLAGFKQSTAIEFISRIVKSVFQKENE